VQVTGRILPVNSQICSSSTQTDALKVYDVQVSVFLLLLPVG
jgi:hypothetical protein